MSPPDVVGARTKVQRAKEHFRDLAAQTTAFVDLNPYGVVVEENAETGERIWRARVSRDVPDGWSLIVGDIVHNLRAALDYVAWQLEIANHQTPDRSTQFPVWDRGAPTSPASKSVSEKDARRKAQITAFGQPAMTLIERLQTDSRGNARWALHPLWLLHQLDIWDKHKLLVIVGGAVATAGGTIGKAESWPPPPVHIERLETGSLEMHAVPVADGAPLMRLKLGKETPDVKVDVKYAFYVAFAKEGPGKGEPVLETLNNLIRFVDETLTLFAALP